jgi:GMP synthase (glutamine-hydrolysing)
MAKRSHLAVLVLGSTVPPLIPRRGDFADWIGAGLRREDPDLPLAVHHIFKGDPLPEPDALLGAVLSGSGAMVTDREPWSEATVRWLARAVPTGLPVLGVCYGHQVLAEAFGGRVDWNPKGREIGTIRVELTAAAQEHPLFNGLPALLRAQATHSQSVVQLPPDATLLGGTALDAHQAFALSERAVGVQFHPEFDADILAGYLAHRAEQLSAEGLDPAALTADLAETPDAAGLLPRFAALCRQWRA